jgi:hypothetical protein
MEKNNQIVIITSVQTDCNEDFARFIFLNNHITNYFLYKI